MYLTDLLTAVTSSGLTVHAVAGWETRHAPDSRGSTLRAVKGVVCHHTAGAATGDHPSLAECVHGRPGLDGLLSQLFLARNGDVYVLGAGVAWHAGEGSGFGLPANDANWYCIGIEAESAGDGDWTPQQLAAYPRLVRALADHYRFPLSMVIGHYEWTPRKIDPHGWPGGMDGLRSQAKTAGGETVNITPKVGGCSTPTQLVTGQPVTVLMSPAGPSMLAGPGRVDGEVTLYLDAPSDGVVQVEVYLVKTVGSAYVYAGSDGVVDFAAGLQHLRYSVKGDVPAGYRLRCRATALGETAPKVVTAIYNLDVRS